MSRSVRAVAVLEVMWDWKAITSSAGYREQAPRWFTINPLNLTGSRLYRWLGEDWDGTVTNACPELVSSAKERGTPDVVWLHNNLSDLQPFDLLLVCGKVAQQTYEKKSSWYERGNERVIYVPHPAARGWTREALASARKHIQEGTRSVNMRIHRGRLLVTLPKLPILA